MTTSIFPNYSRIGYQSIQSQTKSYSHLKKFKPSSKTKRRRVKKKRTQEEIERDQYVEALLSRHSKKVQVDKDEVVRKRYKM